MKYEKGWVNKNIVNAAKRNKRNEEKGSAPSGRRFRRELERLERQLAL